MIGPVTSTTDPQPPDSPKPESPEPDSPEPDAQQPRVGRHGRAWRYTGLGVATVAVALGTATLIALQPPAPTPPSRSVLAVRSAHDDAARLAALARGAGQQAAATVLDRQAAVLAEAPGVVPSGVPASTGTSLSSAGEHELLDGLSASIAARLAALPEVDGPTATLLASVAAGQSLQLDGVAAGAPGVAPPVGPSPTASPSPSPSASCATGGTGPTASATASVSPSPLAAALAAVDHAEAASIYVLETALARTPPGTSEAAARTAALDAHRRQFDGLGTLAATSCATLPPRDPAFALPATFGSDPAPTVAATAESAEQAWAQLVGVVPAPRRPAAAAGLLAAARLGPQAAPAFPGIASAEQAAEQAAEQPSEQPSEQAAEKQTASKR